MSEQRPLAQMFMEACRRERRLLPGLTISDKQRQKDADLYARLKRLDREKAKA